jgi:pyruvate kinase
MSRLRFKIPMKAFTPDPAIRRRMALIWGIESFVVDRVNHTDAMFHQVDEVLLREGLAEIGDKVVVISGSPPGVSGSTNDLRVHRVGDAQNAPEPSWAD